MRFVDLPEWIPLWCREHLGAVPSDLLDYAHHTSEVYALRLADDRDVVVKSRPDQNRRHPPLPADLVDAAGRIRERMSLSWLPPVLGHVDWESQNLRWTDGEPWVVHDWDSLGWLPEAAIAGFASGAFASWGQPTLAPLASSAAFLETYQAARRPFTDEETEVAWAASLWLPLHNARAEAVTGQPPIALTAVREQSEERLRLAGA